MRDETTLALVAALADRSGRVRAAQALADHLGATALFAFVADAALNGALVPAPGFVPTVPGGPGWRDLLAAARSPGIHRGTVRYPDGHATAPATAWSAPGLAFVIVGAELDAEALHALSTASPLVRALLQAEHLEFIATGRLRVATEAASQASSLAVAFDRTRTDLERVAHRITQLQHATGRLASALKPAEVAQVLLEVTETFLQSATGAVYLADGDTGVLHLMAERHLPSGVVDRLRVLALDAPLPIAAALRQREPVWLETYDAVIRAYPGLAAAETPSTELQAMAALPLVHGTRLVGGFVVTFNAPRAFDIEERQWLTTFASQCALAAERARLFEGQQRARLQAETLLQEVERTVHFNEMFAGILGHDLRNPLGAIMTAAHLVLRRCADPASVKPLTRILSSGERMTRMIDQLLDFTRARIGGGVSLNPRHMNLKVLLTHILDEQELSSQGWSFQPRFTGNVEGVWDQDRLAQVFSNLVSNAVQHGSPDQPLALTVDGSDPEWVEVVIRNKGTIPEELVPVLFDPFRGTQHRRDGSQGLGLGLFITDQVVLAHGGHITVTSSEEAGTAFTIRLPRKEP